MGCFGYLCKGCGTQIVGNCWEGGEKCVMIHVRSGKELGRVEGHYDEYGRAIEEENRSNRFRGDGKGINSHSEICASEFSMKDSYGHHNQKRVFNGKACDLRTYASTRVAYDLMENNFEIRESFIYPHLDQLTKAFVEKQMEKVEDKCADLKKISRSLDLIDIFIKSNCYNDELPFVKEFDKLPLAQNQTYSGIVAWHSKCYHEATPEQQSDLTPSESDPNQSWGEVRDEFK